MENQASGPLGTDVCSPRLLPVSHGGCAGTWMAHSRHPTATTHNKYGDYTSPPEISVPHWTTLGGQKSWGGREDFSTCIHGASASANKVFPEEGGTGRRLRARTTTHDVGLASQPSGTEAEKNGYRSEMSPGGGPACARCQEASCGPTLFTWKPRKKHSPGMLA
ncbi:hypothetical protein KUCAC02_009871 [Chaenocephalus aceratus]|uniref:Uncharacterized protein n=1 Tax=Chaenocephalus aceratus TaxID=36190 RepID=A0ACB9VYZ0_CHAAC|nr:hypothetical protein KUCAC02_009871 [Chaenocephalus aceratus]